MRTISVWLTVILLGVLGGCATKIVAIDGSARNPMVTLSQEAKGPYYLYDSRGEKLSESIVSGNRVLFNVSVTDGGSSCWKVTDGQGKVLAFEKDGQVTWFSGPKHAKRRAIHAEIRNAQSSNAYATEQAARLVIDRDRAENALRLMPEVFDGRRCNQPATGTPPRFACRPGDETAFALAYCGAKLVGCEASQRLLGGLFSSDRCETLVGLLADQSSSKAGDLLGLVDSVASATMGANSWVRTITFGLRVGECTADAERACKANYAGWSNQAVAPFNQCVGHVSRYNAVAGRIGQLVEEVARREAEVQRVATEYELASDERERFVLGCTADSMTGAAAQPRTPAVAVPSQAGRTVSFFNDSARIVRIASAVYDEKLADWLVSGWDLVHVGGVSPVQTAGSESIYFYVESVDGITLWGTDAPGSIRLRVDTRGEPFAYVSKSPKISGESRAVGFRKLEVSKGHTMLTLTSSTPATRRYLMGIGGESVRLNEIDVVTGVRITSVTPGSAAASAGLRAGDIVVRADDKPVDALRSLRLAAELSRGRPVKLEFLRDGARRMVALAPELQDPFRN